MEGTIMEGKMKVAVMLGIGKTGFEERDIPKAKDNEVLVKLEYVGICHWLWCIHCRVETGIFHFTGNRERISC